MWRFRRGGEVVGVGREGLEFGREAYRHAARRVPFSQSQRYIDTYTHTHTYYLFYLILPDSVNPSVKTPSAHKYDSKCL